MPGERGPDCPGVGGTPEERDPCPGVDTFGGPDPRPGADAGRFVEPGGGLPPTLGGGLDPRWEPPGVPDGDELPELPDTVGGVPEREVPPGVDEERGLLLPVSDTRGVGLPRSFPDWRRLDAFDWSVLRAACAVSLTF
jgi:hypothetical protein